ncbi:MAG: hypothetical protein HYX68_09310 [Planctomycetes bacterium]|nr:hypothetical protein [Planctomycetota bacterium]
MRRLLGFALCAGLLACAGCLTATLPDALIPNGTSRAVASAVPAVTPEQVTDTNGFQILQALEAEVTKEEQQLLIGGQ